MAKCEICGKPYSLSENLRGALMCKECELSGKTLPVQAAPESTTTQTVQASNLTGVVSRYHDAYLVAKTTSAIGIAVKIVGIILGVLVAIVGIVAGVQHDGAPQFILGGVLLGIIVALPLWVLGVLVCAQAQVLKATLDTAVHGSLFLTKEEMARVMSL